MNPLDWTGGPFLALFGIVAAATLLLTLILRSRLGRADTAADVPQLNVLQIAYLTGGASHAVDAAMVALFAAGAAALDPRRKLAVIDPGQPVAPEFIPFRDAFAAGPRKRFHAEHAARAASIRADLIARGLVPTDDEVRRFRTIAALLLCIPIGLGLAKLMVGLSRDRPVGFLTMGLIVTALLGLLMLVVSPVRNRAGKSVLARLTHDNARATRAPLPAEVPLAFALVGVSALKGTGYESFFPQTSGSGGDGGGGDGGGGGGCGGCGS